MSSKIASHHSARGWDLKIEHIQWLEYDADLPGGGDVMRGLAVGPESCLLDEGGDEEVG